MGPANRIKGSIIGPIAVDGIAAFMYSLYVGMYPLAFHLSCSRLAST